MRKTSFFMLLGIALMLVSNAAWADSIEVSPSNWATVAGTVSQTIFTSLLPNTTYTVLVDVGRPVGEPAEEYSIELLSGLNSLASIDSSTAYITPGMVAKEALSYWVLDGVAQPVTLAFMGVGPQINFANVTVSEAGPTMDPGSPVPTPESSSLILLGIGLGLMGLISKSVSRNELIAIRESTHT